MSFIAQTPLDLTRRRLATLTRNPGSQRRILPVKAVNRRFFFDRMAL
jgi:hypothetical protein